MSIWFPPNKYRFSEVVPESLEAKLPQASRHIRIQFSKMWLGQVWKWIRRYRNIHGYVAPCPKFCFSSRGANFKTIYIGPFSITFKRPWLLISARGLYPNIVKEHNDKQP